jgi:hypothetical protein
MQIKCLILCVLSNQNTQIIEAETSVYIMYNMHPDESITEDVRSQTSLPIWTLRNEVRTTNLSPFIIEYSDIKCQPMHQPL